MNLDAGERGVKEVTRQPPSGYFLVVPQGQQNDAIDLSALFAVLMRSWKFIVAVALVAAVIGAVVSLQMRKVYRAQTLVAPVLQGPGGAGGLGQLGGLAALAGFDLGSAGGRKEEAFATLMSPGFARNFIVSQNLMPILFAEQWDQQAQRWREGEEPPTLEAGVTKFMRTVRFITQDRKTSIVTVAIEWYSPELAAQWANRLVEMVNERLRADAIRNAEQSIEYLNTELAKTNVVELRQAIYGLIEDQVNNAMLANVQREYSFRVIDAAIAPEKRIRPQRTLITVASFAGGLLLAILIVLMRHRRTLSANSVGSHGS